MGNTANDIEARVQRELQWLADKPRPLALVSTTARESADFIVTPRRSCMGYDCACFLFAAEAPAQQVLQMLDGQVQHLLVDVEAKQAIDLYGLAVEFAPATRLLPCKPNDATVESVDRLLQNRLGHDLRHKRILVHALGNLGTKTALRLAERGAQVLAWSRSADKCRSIASALNLMLPAHNAYPITSVGNPGSIPQGSLDAIVSCSSNRGGLGMAEIALLRDGGLAIDAGIDNFSPAFITQALERQIDAFRLDTRMGFPFLLIPLLDFYDCFFADVCGSGMIEGGIRLVSGGCIGKRGTVIVDSFRNPTQIVGVANGTGGVLDEALLEPEERNRLSRVRNYVESRGQTVR